MNNFDEMPKGMTPNLPLWSFQFQPNSKLAIQTRKDLEIHLITRALKDEEFKQELLANPKAVIEKELDIELPSDLEINVLEETEDTLYMILPCNPYEGISEEELKSLVGMTYEDVSQMTYEDVSQWILTQQKNTLLDDQSSVKIIARAWRDEVFKQELSRNPLKVIENELKTEIKQNIQIKVCIENEKELYLILPKVLDNFIDPLDSDEINLELNMPMIMGSEIACRITSGATRPVRGCRPGEVPTVATDEF